MPTASEVATELRKIADQLDKTPEAEIVKPILRFHHSYQGTKENFIDLAKVFPRPIAKGDGYKHDEYTLSHDSEAVEVYASIGKSKVCTLVEEARPARYECTPLLSLEEEAALGTF
jgi:hypothetical protein